MVFYVAKLLIMAVLIQWHKLEEINDMKDNIVVGLLGLTISFFVTSTFALVPLGDYVMVENKKDKFVRLCKAETTKEIENIVLTKNHLYLGLPEKTDYLILKKTDNSLFVRNEFNVNYIYKVKRISSSNVYQWNAYEGSKRMDDLSFYAASKKDIGKFKTGGNCQWKNYLILLLLFPTLSFGNITDFFLKNLKQNLITMFIKINSLNGVMSA